MPPNPPSKAHGFAIRSMSLCDMQISKSIKKNSWPPPPKSWGRPWTAYTLPETNKTPPEKSQLPWKILTLLPFPENSSRTKSQPLLKKFQHVPGPPRHPPQKMFNPSWKFLNPLEYFSTPPEIFQSLLKTFIFATCKFPNLSKKILGPPLPNPGDAPGQPIPFQKQIKPLPKNLNFPEKFLPFSPSPKIALELNLNHSWKNFNTYPAHPGTPPKNV